MRDGRNPLNTRTLNRDYISLIKSNKSSRKEYAEIAELFKFEAAKYHKRLPTEFLFVPKIYTSEIVRRFQTLVAQCYAILTKITDRYIADEDYRRLFGFPAPIEEMILAPAGYACPIPLMRMDVFFDEDTGEFKFCEFNTDGTSGMHEEMVISSRLMESGAYKEFSRQHKITQYPLVDGWIDVFLNIYSGYAGKKENPTFAIADFTESGVTEEFETFRQGFEARGYPTVIADVRQLTYDGRHLYKDKTRIDAVYRRAVTDELAAKIESVQPLKKAILDQNVCLIGHIKTQIAHNKILFYLINKEQTLSMMTEEEKNFIRKHFPFTAKLSESDHDEKDVLSDKDAWVIKPTNLYASKNVSVGKDMTEAQWRQAYAFGKENGYILQSFTPPYESENCYFGQNGRLICGKFMNMAGLYVYGGKFSGVYSRASRRPTISSNYGGFSLGTLFAESE